MKKIVLPVLLMIFLTSSKYFHDSPDQKTMREGVTIKTSQDTIPVLIGKERNPVLRILIDIPGEMNDMNLSELLVNSSGTTDINDINSVSIYYSGSKEQTKAPIQYGESLSPSKKMVFKGSLSLNKGENYFWVSYTLKETAKLTNQVGAGCEYIVLGEKIKIKPARAPSPFSNRIGIALRQHGQDDCDTYRIPGLATTNEGTLIAVYDNRYNGPVDLQADVDVGMSRSTDGGQTWEPMKVIMDMGEWGGKPEDENGIGDPSVLVDRETGTIWVAAVWAHGTPGKRNWHSSRPGMDPDKTSQFVLVKSEDDGLTWSDPINITSSIKDPAWYLLLQGPGKGITLSDGTIVFPAQFKDHENMPHSTIVWSKDHGENWSIGTGAKPNTTEAQLIELDDGSIMLNMRDNRGGSRSVYTSKDLGTTWEIHPTSRSSLVEPVCNASLIKGTFLVNGEEQKLVFFVNPHSTKGRHHMTVKMSTDDGKTWPEKYWLLLDEGRGRGYPSMTQIDDEHIGILYEGSQADLVFEKIHIDEFNTQESLPAQEEPFYYAKPVFKPLEDGMGYHNYRIPSLLVTKNNVLLAMAEGREDMNNDHAKNDLVLMRSTNSGETWEDPVVITQAGDNVTMNPVLVQASDGTIILCYIYFPEKRHTRQMKSHGVEMVEPGLKGDLIQRVYIVTSNDDGLTWSDPRELTDIVKSGENTIASICGPGTGIILTRGKHTGRVIIPMQEQFKQGETKETLIFSLYSDNNGKTWHHGELAPPDDDGSGGEVQMVELEDGGVMLSTRNSSGYRRLAFSRDGGHTWTKLYKEKSLKDTGCMSPLLRYRWADDEKPGVIIHVGVTARVDGRKRGKAEFCLSYDDGKTWPVRKVFHEQAFDYSSLAIMPDGSIGMLAEYDFNGERLEIKLANLNLEWIETVDK